MPAKDLLASIAMILPAIILSLFYRALRSYDIAVLMAVNSVSESTPIFVIILIDAVGSLPFWLLIVLFLRLRKSRGAATFLLVGLIIDTVVSTVFKFAVSRPRPPDSLPGIRLLGLEDSGSMPSGHSERSFMAAIVLGKFYVKRQVPLIMLGVLVAFSRVYIGAHYPLDTVVGAFTGIAVGLVVRSLQLQRFEAWMEKVWSRVAK
ncbi:MAG: phosphatase PAP2 family protein [Thaumarchaeota archaeon]|nr:phosphatase PAP2 family protein [Nitrososphaerota archaeon]